MNVFLLQHRDGSYLSENYSRLWVVLASEARRFDLQEAFRISRRVPQSRIVAMSAAGTYSPEELRASEQFVEFAEAWF